jgi:hypothetical protein
MKKYAFDTQGGLDKKNKKLINPGFPAAHPEPVYRCFLPDLTGFTGP